MKQKHLLRPPVWLASLLLIVVMAIGGSTAWAQDPTADFQSLGLTTTGVKTLNGVTVNFQAQTSYGAPEIWSTSDVVTFSCDAGKAIAKIQFYNIAPYGAGTIDVTADGVSTPMSYQNTSTWTWEGSALSVEFKGHGDADMLFRGVKVWLEDTAPAEPIEYTMNIVGAPVGASVTLDGQMMTNGSTYTVAKNLTTNDVTATPVEGYFVTKDYNATTHIFTVTYVAGQEGAYNFKGASIPYTSGGVASTLTTGKNLLVGDVFTAEGSTLTFTAVSSSWSNSAERLKLGSGTAFTLAAPEGYHITEIVFNTDANNLKGLTATSGLTKDSNTKATWTGEEESVAFSITADTWIQTIALKMISVVVDPVDYTVVINNAPEGANITLNGQAITANGTYTIAKTLSLTDLVVANIAGYNVDKTYNADTHTFTVTFTEIPHYTVHITGANGLYFTIAGEGRSWSDGAIIETDDTITEDDIIFSNDMYDMVEKRVEGTDIYLTFTEKSITYTVNITGGPEDATIKITNPKTYMDGTYKNGDVVVFNRIINADYVDATLPLYTSSVQVTSNAVNVTYTALESYNYYVTYTGQVPSAPAVTVGGAPVQQYPGYDDFIYLNEPLTAEAVATAAENYGIKVTITDHPHDSSFGHFTVDFTKYATINYDWSSGFRMMEFEEGESSLQYFTLYFNQYMAQDISEIPEGCTFTKDDEPIEFTMYGYYYAQQFYFNTNQQYTAQGVYHFYLPAGAITFTDGAVNPELNYTWTIKPCTSFAIDTWDGVKAIGEWDTNNSQMKQLSGFKVIAPEDHAFDSVDGSEVTLNVREGYDGEATNVTAAVEIDLDGNAVFTFPEAYTKKCNLYVTIPRGVITDTNSLVNKEIQASFSVNPYFRVNNDDVMAANPNAKRIDALTIPQSNGYDFDDMTTLDVTIDGDKTACAVAETVEGDLTITLPTPFTTVGMHTFAIAAGALSANGGLLNEEALSFTVNVTPTLAVDETGWTSFNCVDPFTLEDGYTPYIVVAGEGDNIAYKELLGTPKTEDIDVHMDGSFGTDNTLTVSGNAWTAPVLSGKAQITFGGSYSNEGGYFFSIYTGFWIEVVSTNANFEIASVEPYNWDTNSKSNNYNVEPIAGGFRLTWYASTWCGGLKVSLATGEYNKPIVPANTGILIQGAAKADVTYAKASGTTADVTGNLLRECGESATWSAEGETYFDLADGLFQKVGSSIAAEAGKAYLVRTGVDEYHIGYDADGAPVIAAIAITDKTTSAVTYLAPKAGDNVQLNDAGVSKVVITEPIENVNVTYTRNFKNANAWVSWYVPFTINAAANNNAVFAKLVTVTYADNTGKVVADPADGTLTFILSRLSTEDVKANTPYFVYVKEAGDYYFTADALEMTRVKSIDCSTVDYKFTFEGAYEPYFGNAEGTCIGLSTSGKYITVKEDQSLAPYRWHCLVESRDNLYNNIDPALIEGARILVIGEDAEATAILNALTDQQNANTYDLQGRAVQRMNQGVYVKDGKKVLNK